MGSEKNATDPGPESKMSEREQLRIEFYKTYDVMTGIRIAATLGGFFGLMILLLLYKSRCKSSKQLQDPRLTAAAAAAVAAAEAQEQALAAALEAIARLPPRVKGGRRSLCVEVNEFRSPRTSPRFASIGGGYEALFTPSPRTFTPTLAPPPILDRRCSSGTCSSTGSGYLDRRGSNLPVPALPINQRAGRWEFCYPIDIQVIQPTPQLSPSPSESRVYAVNKRDPAVDTPSGRAPLASMASLDPPEDSRSMGLDSVFLPASSSAPETIDSIDTEDEVSGFSTDSETGPRDRTQACRAKGNLGRGHRAASSIQETPMCSPEIELRHRPPGTGGQGGQVEQPVWSQETLF